MMTIPSYQARLLMRSPMFVVTLVVLLVYVAFGVVDRAAAGADAAAVNVAELGANPAAGDAIATVVSPAAMSGAGTAPAALAVQILTNSHELLLLAFMLLAAWAGALARSGRASEMIDTYRQSNTALVAGQAAGLITVFAAVWLALAAWGAGLAWAAGARGGPGAVNAAAQIGVFWLRQALPGAVMAAGVGYAAGYIVGSQFAAYPVAAAVWFAVVMGSMQVARSMGFRWLGVLDVSSAHVFDRWLTAIATAALGLAAVGLAAGAVKRRRESAAPRRAAAMGAVAVGVLLFGLALGASWARWAPRMAVSAASAATALEESAWAVELRPATDILAYDMNIRLSPEQSTLRNEVVMQVANSGNQPLEALEFTLKAEFTIEQCQVRCAAGAGGAAWTDASLVREASGILVSLRDWGSLQPGEVCEVSLTYEGKVQDWRLGRFLWLSNELNAVVAEGGTWIPAGSAWYPVAGRRPTRYAMSTRGAIGSGVGEGGTAGVTAVWLENSHPAARMRVRVTGATDVRTGIPASATDADGAYVFEAESTRDLFLAAGGEHGREVALSGQARAFLEARWRFLEELCPSGAELAVVEPPSLSLILGVVTESARLAPPGVMFSGASLVERVAGGGVSSEFDMNRIDNAVLAAWWGVGGVREGMVRPWSAVSQNIMAGVLRYAHVLLLESGAGGEAGRERAERMMESAQEEKDRLLQSNAMLTLDGIGKASLSGLFMNMAPTSAAMLTLDGVRKEHGVEAVRQVYRQLRAERPGRDGVVTEADLAAAIQAATAHAAQPAAEGAGAQ